VFKDLAEIFYKMFTTLAAMVAVKCTNDGEKLLAQNYTIFSASVYITILLNLGAPNSLKSTTSY